MRVRSAENGEVAVRLDSERPAHLVLMDISMPVMDCKEAARRIRAGEAEHQLPASMLVALTANSANVVRTAAADSGMNAYLEKPLRRRMLIVFVEEHFAPA